MNKDKKQYIHFNPTQINNYGDGENSVQTVGRVVKEQIDNPMGFIGKITSMLNSLWALIFRSIPYFILITIIPFALCVALGAILLHYTLSPNPDLGYFIKGSFSAATEVLGLIPEVISIILPPAIIIGCGILCLALSTLIMASLLYPNNPRAKKNFFTAFFGAQLGLFLYNTFKSK